MGGDEAIEKVRSEIFSAVTGAVLSEAFRQSYADYLDGSNERTPLFFAIAKAHPDGVASGLAEIVGDAADLMLEEYRRRAGLLPEPSEATAGRVRGLSLRDFLRKGN
jgi:hypothetical protein